MPVYGGFDGLAYLFYGLMLLPIFSFFLFFFLVYYGWLEACAGSEPKNEQVSKNTPIISLIPFPLRPFLPIIILIFFCILPILDRQRFVHIGLLDLFVIPFLSLVGLTFFIRLVIDSLSKKELTQPQKKVLVSKSFMILVLICSLIVFLIHAYVIMNSSFGSGTTRISIFDSMPFGKPILVGNLFSLFLVVFLSYKFFRKRNELKKEM